MFRKLRRQIKDLDRRLRRSAGASPGMDRFSASDPPENAADRPGLEGIFWSNDGPLVHKWHHYLPIYERYFSDLRGREVRFLEIGVSKGGSLAMWRRYFGEAAILYGVDIDPACAACNGIHAQVRIGSQSDADFLRRVVDEMGGVDVVLDDGSHISSDIRASLATLFPLLQDGGLYLIEDLHATYWDSHDGGYQKPGSFIEDLRQMVDDMHHWYHDQGQRVAATAGTLSALHLYDSIAVLEKSVVPEPRHSEVGDR